MLIRSKCPSMLGVGSQPLMPPAIFTGPVWTALIPICWNAAHRSSAPRADRNDWLRLVMNDNGYAVNQTEARSTAARGFGWANGLLHMLACPAS